MVRHDDRVRLRVRVENLGDRAATDILLRGAFPFPRFGSHVKTSCRLLLPDGEGSRTCTAAFDDRQIAIDRLPGHQRAELRYEIVIRRPPCVTYEAPVTFAVTSDQTPEITDGVALIAIDDADAVDRLPSCNTDEAGLREHVPFEFRHLCQTNYYPEGNPLASVVCHDPGSDVVTVVYELFSSRRRTRATYDRRRHVVHAGRRTCGTHDGESAYSSVGRRGVGRLMCWMDDDGQAWIEWTDLRYRIYAHAHRPDARMDLLYTWWFNKSGPYARR